MDNPKQAVSLATMLTDYDGQCSQLTKDLEVETIRERGTPKLTKGRFEYLEKFIRQGKQAARPEDANGDPRSFADCN